MPTMPNKQNARYRDWKIVFEGILAQLDSEVELTLVGGSLGGCFLLKYFSENSIHTDQDVSFLDIPKRQLRIHSLHLIAACIAEGDFTAPMNYVYL